MGRIAITIYWSAWKGVLPEFADLEKGGNRRLCCVTLAPHRAKSRRNLCIALYSNFETRLLRSRLTAVGSVGGDDISPLKIGITIEVRSVPCIALEQLAFRSKHRVQVNIGGA